MGWHYPQKDSIKKGLVRPFFNFGRFFALPCWYHDHLAFPKIRSAKQMVLAPDSRYGCPEAFRKGKEGFSPTDSVAHPVAGRPVSPDMARVV